MNVDFWSARWSQHRIGFHLPGVNPHLLSRGPRWLEFGSWREPMPLAGRRVLVPLCGKSVDLRWLAEHGAHVIGVEFVERAALSFFSEQRLSFAEQDHPCGRQFVSTTPGLDLRIFVADFLELSSVDLGPIDAIYDRAALIAVEPVKRARYVQQLARLSRTNARLLLVALEHDTGGGPPFTVAQSELSALLTETFVAELVVDSDAMAHEPQFAQRGATYCREHVWLATRR